MLDIEENMNKRAYAFLFRLETLGLLKTYTLKLMTPATDTMKVFAKYYNDFMKEGVLPPEYESLEIGANKEDLFIGALKFFENKIKKTPLLDYLEYRFEKDYLYYLFWYTLETTNEPKSLSYYTKLYTIHNYFMDNYLNLSIVNDIPFKINGVHGAGFFLSEYKKFLEKKGYLNESAIGMSNKVWTLFCIHMKDVFNIKIQYNKEMLDEAERIIELANKDTAPETKPMPLDIMGDVGSELKWLLENDEEFRNLYEKKKHFTISN